MPARRVVKTKRSQPQKRQQGNIEALRRARREREKQGTVETRRMLRRQRQDKVVRLYQAKRNVIEIAHQLHIQPAEVRNCLAKAGLLTDWRHAARRAAVMRNVKVRALRNQRIVDMYLQGKTYRVIGKAVGVTGERVRMILMNCDAVAVIRAKKATARANREAREKAALERAAAKKLRAAESKQFDTLVKRLYRQGHTCYRIGKITGKPTFVLAAMKRLGLRRFGNDHQLKRQKKVSCTAAP